MQKNGKTGVIRNNSAQFNIDLNNTVDPNLARSPFHNFKFQVVPVDKTKILQWHAAADAAHSSSQNQGKTPVLPPVKLSANLSDMTPFHIACDKGNVRSAELIMKNSIENNIDFNFYSGFIYACQCGHVKIVELLLKNSVEFNVDLNAKIEFDGETGFNYAFHYACVSGHVKIVELLIKKSVEYNIDLNVKNHNGFSGYALSSGQVKKLILDNSAQFNIDLN